MAPSPPTRTGARGPLSRLPSDKARRRVPEAAARHVNPPCQCRQYRAASLLKSQRFRFTSSRRRRTLSSMKSSGGSARTFGSSNHRSKHMRLVIIGAGFAGMYAALSAARLRDIQGVSPEELEIALVAPEPTLVVRPRLYEPKPETLTAPLLDVLKAIDVEYVQGSAETIDTRSRMVQIAAAKGTRKTLSYDRLVVATGSRLFRPNIPGLAEHGFSVDSLDDAVALDKHLHSLADRPARNGRDTVVVAGGGFTGIEAATEMPTRLRKILGKNARSRVIIVERNSAIAPDM